MSMQKQKESRKMASCHLDKSGGIMKDSGKGGCNQTSGYRKAARKAAATSVTPAPPMRTEIAPLTGVVVGAAASLAAAAVPLIAFATSWKAAKLRAEVSTGLMALEGK